MPTQEPTLQFFTNRPDGWATSASLASSLQSLETSFFLIALGRYPHALSTCAGAIESAMQAGNIGAKEKDGLQDLFRKAKINSQAFHEFIDEDLNDFRNFRNEITHHGFSPQDDSKAASIYLETALPYLSTCFRELHSFDLMSSLLAEYSEHLRAAKKIHSLAKSSLIVDFDISYCLHGFGQKIRWEFKENFSPRWSIETLIHAEEIGVSFERRYNEHQKLKRMFEIPWPFDCPVCDAVEGVIAELDSVSLDSRDVIPKRMACTNCGFVVKGTHPFLSQVLLEKQVAKISQRVLDSHGII